MILLKADKVLDLGNHAQYFSVIIAGAGVSQLYMFVSSWTRVANTEITSYQNAK